MYFEHRGLQLEPRGPAAAGDELSFERREERLGDGVVVRAAKDAGIAVSMGVALGLSHPRRLACCGCSRADAEQQRIRVRLPLTVTQVVKHRPNYVKASNDCCRFEIHERQR